MKILLLYHFFHPDPVVSSRMFSDLACDLAEDASFEVTVFTGNRDFKSGEKLPVREEVWQNVRIRRFSRPGLSQGNHIFRLLNSFVLQLKWLRALFREKYDVVILGTDPQFSFLMFPWMRLLQRKARLVEWAFDIYPDAIIAMGGFMGTLAKITLPFTRFARSFADEIWDIGDCMRKRLMRYNGKAPYFTFTPWATAGKDEIDKELTAKMRKELFGDAKLTFLYSGTVGYAHDLAPFIELARRCRQANLPVKFCFAGHGNTYREQTASITPEDDNISLAGFASASELASRLAAADVHLISLRERFRGVVVPSKFFGSLAAGRMTLFSGDPESAVAKWIREYECGLVLDDDTVEAIRTLCEHPELLKGFQQRAEEAYKSDFSRESVTARISQRLRKFSSESSPMPTR